MSEIVSNKANWQLTLNNPEEGSVQLFRDFCESNCKYAICCHELAPTTNTPHLHCFCQFTKKRRLAWIKKHLCNEVHAEQTKGDVQSNIDYIKKDGDVRFELGTPVHQRQRTDLEYLEQIQQQLASGKSLETVCAEAAVLPGALVVKHGRHIVDAFSLLQPSGRRFKPIVIYIYGGTGKGKSYFANNYDPDFCIISDADPWNAGYRRSRVCIIEEFTCARDPKWYNTFLDEYPCRINQKCSQPVSVDNEIIFILSNDPIEVNFTNHKHDADAVAQFQRRCHFVYNCLNAREFDPVSEAIARIQTDRAAAANQP